MPIRLTKRPRVSLFKQHGQCFCCDPARPVHRPTDTAPWQHLTGSAASTFHVHRWAGCSDYDGYVEHWAVLGFIDFRDATDDDDAWRLAVCNEITASGDQDVEIRGDKLRAGFYERTDEGFRDVSLDGCDRPWCPSPFRAQRDHRAESMGY